MNKQLLTILFIAFSSSIFAAFVPQEQANTLAINAYFQKLNLYHETVAPADVQIDAIFEIDKDGQTTMYIYNFKNYGYLILSADDVVNPVIAYSFEGQYDPNLETDNFNPWIEGRSGAVAYARSNGIEADASVKAKWNNIQEMKVSFPEGGKSVDPLLTATWNQDNPYNYLMPLDAAGPGGRCYVGCVATAMAQIMQYWRYPEMGEHSKTHTYGGYPSVTANFGETTYDWDGMLDNSDSKVNMPMALIGLHAAVSVSMHWGPYGSGAQSTSVPFAMSYYFKYDDAVQYLDKQGVLQSTWNAYLQSELDDNCPVYYSGYDGNTGNYSGHAFVLDGYQTDNMYHFNFGWSGYGNGWFDITDPQGYEWYYGQGMVRNIMPDDPAYPYGCTPDYERSTLDGSFEDGSGPLENYDGSANCSWLINPQTTQDSVKYIKLSFAMIDTEDDDVISIYDGATMDAELLGTYSGSTLPTGTINSSGNQMLVVFEADGDGNTGAGFKIEYESMLPTFCSGMAVYEAPAGSFDDGSGDFYYRNNTNCMYKIAPEWADGVTMTFTEFDTEEGVDILKVYDASNNQLIEELSGSDLPNPIYMESGQIFLVFQSDGGMNYGGFTVEYEAGNVGVDENEIFEGLQVYPNPASDQLSVSFTQSETSNVSVKLISVTGELVYTESKNSFAGIYASAIDLSTMAKGVYFLSISNETGTVNEKVIIK